MDTVTEFARQNSSQSHLCICNDSLYDMSVANGTYGFPHAGQSRTKSFWRAVASMYNIGPNDLMFLYRTKGEHRGCQEINGPFRIYAINGLPAIYYDLESTDLPMKVRGEADCKVRFLFKKTTQEIFSIADNYELIKKYETKDIWGYRHPAVMNIGAARKKSVTSFTNKQTLLILSLIREFGEKRLMLSDEIPLSQRITYYTSLPRDNYHFQLDDDFLLSADTVDEAFFYAYILRGLKNPSSKLHGTLMTDFSQINDEKLFSSCGKSFKDLAVNVMMETIISPHLQEELDIVLMDKEDSNLILLEVKAGDITQEDTIQTQKYLDLLSVIFPRRKAFANIIGSGVFPDVQIKKEFQKSINLVSYRSESSGMVRFNKI